MPDIPDNAWTHQQFVYKALTGGVNFLVSDSEISEDQKRLEFASQINFENFRQGSLLSQDGNIWLNKFTTDVTKILGGGEFITNTKRYIVYTKASGKVYAFDFDTQTENQINTGLDTAAEPNFVPFNGHIIFFNGVDAPWEWDGIIGHATTVLMNTPVSWVTTKPKFGAVLAGHLLAVAGTTVYGSDLGNENSWNTPNDSFSESSPFNDVRNITAIHNYGQNVVIHTDLPAIYLLSGLTTSGVDPFQVTRMATNRAATINDAIDSLDNKQWFFSGDALVNIQTTQFGTILQGYGEDLLIPIKPLFTNDFVFPIPNVNRFNFPVKAILLAYYQKNYLLCYFQSLNGNGQYDICAIWDVNNKCWYFRQAKTITAAWQFQKSYIITGTSDGKILQEFSGSTLFDGLAMFRQIRTPWFQWGMPANKKNLFHGWFWFTASSLPANIVFNFRVDFNDQIVKTRTPADYNLGFKGNNAIYDNSSNYDVGPVYAANTDGLIHFPIDVEGRAIQIEIINQDINSQLTLKEFTLEVQFDDTQ